MPELERDRGEQRVATGLVVGALCAATFVLKAFLSAARVDPGYGDVAHYFVLARNLFEGRGMWVDYSFTWFTNPRGLPVSGASFWMPMPSWVGALGMLARGEATFHAACEGMIALTSLAPLVAYLTGRDLLGSAKLGLVAAFLAAAFYPFLDKASLPLTHGPALVFGGLALWATVRSLGDRRFLWAAGALAALAQQNRSDGVVWIFVVPLAHWLRPGGRTPLRALWPAAVAWLLSMTPLFASNMATLGRPWPGSLLRAALIRGFPELYSLPHHVTLESYLEQGWHRILLEKADAAWENAVTFATSLAAGSGTRLVSRYPLDALTEAPLGTFVLMLIGARLLFRRSLAAFWLHAGLQWALHSFLLTQTGRASLRAAMFALYPLMLAVAAHGLVATATWAARIIPAQLAGARRAFALSLGALVLCLVSIESAMFAAASMQARASRNTSGQASSAEIVEQLLAPHGLQNETFLIDKHRIHSFHAHTRIRVATIPFAAELEEIRDAAAQIGATHLIVDPDSYPASQWPAITRIPQSPLFEHISSGTFQRENLGVYRIVFD